MFSVYLIGCTPWRESAGRHMHKFCDIKLVNIETLETMMGSFGVMYVYTV